MRVAIAKPDYGVRGGFELVMDRVADGLLDDGHDVRWMQPSVGRLDRRPFGIQVPDTHWEAEPEFFRYLALVDVFHQVDAGWADVVISCQPPSFTVDHPRHLCLFAHHHRLYYDLAEAARAAGLVDVDTHEHATALVRAVDQPALERVGHILAISDEVRGRLTRFNGLDAGVFNPGLGFRAELPAPDPADRFDHALCVSRHEFPKRTELFVQAMHLVPDVTGVSIGDGGRRGWAQELDHRFTSGSMSAQETPSRSLWLCNPRVRPGRSALGPASNVRFMGAVDVAVLDRCYRDALCVVAPAYLEDYGLTAIEAMAYGKPLVVCADGGHLTAFVDHGVNGLVVAPEAQAIAAAVRQLADDPALARRLGAAGREMVPSFSWPRTVAEVRAGIERVAA